MSSMPPSMPQPQAPAKKTSPLVWILGGVAVLMFGVLLTCGVAGFLGMRMLKNAGFDSALMKSNPGLAMAKMAAAANPDLEMVSSDDRSGTVTMRDKKTGKTVTYRFDADRKTLEIVGDNGEHVVINGGQGNQGTMTVQSKDGTYKYGAGSGKAPSWVPAYPGSDPQSTMSAQSKEGSMNSFTFKTSDAPGKVMQFYQDQLKAAGYTVNMVSGGDQGGMVQGEDSAKSRSILVTAGGSAQGTDVSVVAKEK